MKVNFNDVASLNLEFNSMQLGFNRLHDDMQTYLDAYRYNIYYGNKPNQPANSRVGVNLLAIFADKLWHYTSPFPKISVPPMPNDRQGASLREKIIMATHEKNMTDMLWGDWTFDGGIMGAAISETIYDVRKKCVTIRRYDPRYCYWQKSDANNEGIQTFWSAVPMTKTAILMKYGIEVTGGEGMVFETIADGEQVPIDSEEYFLVIRRVDSERVVSWVGSQFVIKPYRHLQGEMPVDIAMPLRSASKDVHPDFFLRRLLDMQAEFNELWRRRANVVRKLGNPVVWGRGIYKQNEQEIKRQLMSDGGFVGLKENGELALLTIPETKMIDTALQDTFQKMKDLAGFPTATFGETIGANTSGDALSMYFTPTTRMIDHHNITWKAFLRSINAKILRGYEQFLKIGEERTLSGYMPHGTVSGLSEDGKPKYERGAFSATFTRDSIGGHYNSVIFPQAVAPKDEVNYKRLMLDAVTNKFLSRTTAYDEIGILSPEDELALLKEEQSDPFINPDGNAKLMQAAGVAQEVLDPLINNQEPVNVPPDEVPAGY